MVLFLNLTVSKLAPPLLILLYALLALSQGGQAPDAAFMEQYRQADRLYHEALAVESAEDYDEEKEAELNRQALERFKGLLPKVPAKASGMDSLYFLIYFKTGELEHYFDRQNEALGYYRQAIAVEKRSPWIEDSLLFHPLLFSGIIHYNRNQYDSALAYLHWAEKVKQQYGVALNGEERLYNNLGAIHFATGNFRQAKNYFQKAADVLPRNHPYYEDLLVNYLINLASAHTTLEEYDAANSIYQKILSYGINANEINHNTGIINLNLGAAGKALDYFRRVNYANGRVVRLYNDMGLAHFNLGQYDSARHYFSRGIEMNRQYNAGNPNVAHGLVLKSLGDLEMHHRNPGKALEHYQQALHQFYPAYSGTERTSNPQTFSGVFSYINLFNTLTAKADALHALYAQSGGLPWAKEELEAYRSAFRLIDYVERSYDSDEARLFLNHIKYLVHGKPIDIACELYKKTGENEYLEEAWFFDQKNKASVLAFNQQVNARLAADSTLRKREKKLRIEITRLSLRAAAISDSGEIARTAAAIRENEIQLGRLQEQVSRSLGPEAYNAIPSMEHIRRKILDDKGAVVSFHLSEEEITTFIISSAGSSVSQKPLPPAFAHEVLRLTQMLRNSSLPPDDSLSARLYRLFFNELDKEKISKLVIIPDDELNYLPFEALKDSAGRYLLEDFTVQYQYSTALLQKEKGDLSGSSTLAFAPFSEKGYSDSLMELTLLRHSGSEIENIEGEKYTGGQATKQKLLENIDRHPILHLATHASANTARNNLSYIALAPFGSSSRSDYLLYGQEIYNLPLQHTRLVILSACETGAGVLQRGEGVMSLSRAFAYAGCPNIITSLWKADDQATAYLANRVHGYLEDGLAIADAVRRAKLDYLSDASIHPRMKHPSYWAHLVFIGNYFPAASVSYWWWIGGSFLFLVTCFWFFRRRNH